MRQWPKSGIVSLFAAVLATHLPLWMLQRYAAMPLPLLHWDLMLALLVFTVNRRAGMLCVVLAWALAVLRGVALNYHFHDLAEYLDSARFVDLLSLGAYLTAGSLLGVAVLLVVVACLLRLLSGLRFAMGQMLLLMLACALLDWVNGSATAIGLGRDRALVPVNVMGSAGYNLVRSEMVFMTLGSQPLQPIDPLPNSYAELRSIAARGDVTGMAILVESLGLPVDPAVRDWLLAQFDAPGLRDRWTVEFAEEDFRGSTIAGELRVLCGRGGHYSRLTRDTAQDCLPRLFDRAGPSTLAIHGFSPRMFDRSAWWPVAGFDEVVFGDALAAKGARSCQGAFEAVCDQDLLAEAFARAADSRNRFVYALTIGTHLPLPADHALRRDVAALCGARRVDDSACALIDMTGNLMRSMAQGVAQSSGPSLIVIVGDHSPPFIRSSSRHAFSQQRVPLVLVRRKPSM